MTLAIDLDPPAEKKFSHVIVWRIFVVALAVATVFPLLVVAPVRHLFPDARASFYLFSAVNLVAGMGHVSATGYFFTDRRMRSHFNSQANQYYGIPVLLVVSVAIFCTFLNSTGLELLGAAFFAWQLWHYQKQNFGLLSFVCAGTDKVPLSIWERRTLALAAIAGILGFFHKGSVNLPQYTTQLTFLYQAGALLYFAVPVSFMLALVTNPALRKNRLRLAFFALGASFFLPTYLFDDGLLAIALGYALGHGLQYLVFMGFVSVKSEKPFLSAFILFLFAFFGGLLLVRVMGAQYAMTYPYANLVHGALLGVVMSHFVLDARIWRLREKFQREYLREKFSFVFNR